MENQVNLLHMPRIVRTPLWHHQVLHFRCHGYANCRGMYYYTPHICRPFDCRKVSNHHYLHKLLL